MLVCSGKEAAREDPGGLADACKKLDIKIGKRHEDYCFDGAGLAKWVENTTDINPETGGVFGGGNAATQM